MKGYLNRPEENTNFFQMVIGIFGGGCGRFGLAFLDDPDDTCKRDDDAKDHGFGEGLIKEGVGHDRSGWRAERGKDQCASWAKSVERVEVSGVTQCKADDTANGERDEGAVRVGVGEPGVLHQSHGHPQQHERQRTFKEVQDLW